MQPGSPIEFDIRTPLDGPSIKRHIKSALRRKLPGVVQGTGKGRVSIVASGPSAQIPEGPTAAINNAINLFKTPPTYWVGCDPQSQLADFLPDDPPEGTTYLVASKCHPAVFDRLKDRNVVIWHVDDYPTPEPRMPCAVSVTLCAMSLLWFLGYDDIHTYGWDGCYIDGKGYAQPQAHEQSNITVCLDEDRAFPTTHSWALEGEDARTQLYWVRRNGLYDLTVHGPGFFGALMQHFELAVAEAA